MHRMSHCCFIPAPVTVPLIDCDKMLHDTEKRGFKIGSNMYLEQKLFRIKMLDINFKFMPLHCGSL